MNEILELTALQLGAAIKKGEVSPVEAAKAALAQIEDTKSDNAFVALTAEAALQRAEEVEKKIAAKELASPLAGVPLGIKDNICTKGVSTTCAGRILTGFRPAYDATLVEKLDALGAVSLGKLNMDEFAMGSTTETSFYGPTRNPWDPGRVPGGSSGGAAAAVAARSCWYAIGSDTGGSIRQPAADCGVTGIKPTYYIIAAAEASSNLSRFDGVKYGWRAEGYEDLTDLYNKTRTEGFGSEVKRRILLGAFVLSSGYYDAYYKKALQVKGLIKKAFDDAFEQCDLMLTPVAPATAPRLGESLSDPLQMYLSDIYTVSVNQAGLPGLSMPCGFDSKGMPVGTQLIGPALGEAKVLNAAHAFQLDTDYHKKSPARKVAR